MKILVVGGTGTLGKAVVSLLKKDHTVISVGRTSGDYQVDIENKASIKKMFEEIGTVDGIISTCGDAGMGPFQIQSDEDIDLAINSKLRGQIDLIRVGVHSVKENGFILITTGTASHNLMPGTSSITMANAGLEGYIRAINIEQFNGVRVNAVSPSFVKETVEMMKLDVPNAISAADIATVYKMVMESGESGIVADVSKYLNRV